MRVQAGRMPEAARAHAGAAAALLGRRQGPVFRTDITRGARAKISVDVVEVFHHVSVATVSGHPTDRVAIEDHPNKHLPALQGGIIDDRRRRQSCVVFTVAACAVDRPQHAPCIGDARVDLQLTRPRPRHRRQRSTECTLQSPTEWRRTPTDWPAGIAAAIAPQSQPWLWINRPRSTGPCQRSCRRTSTRPRDPRQT